MFNLLNLFKPKEPEIKENTFLVWEPCSKSHGEVVVGYTKYLVDLGYHVSVLVSPERYKEGLFSRFQDSNVTLNKLSQKQIKKFFKKNNLKDVKGVLVTTIGKLCDSIHYEEAYCSFNSNADKSKIFFVEHEAKAAIDNNSWKNDLITLRTLNYKNASSIVVNPHYFGKIDRKPKNDKITNFITIGALRAKRNNSDIIVNAVKKLIDEGIDNFKITVVGKGSIKELPKELHKFVDIKGRLAFDKMYDEIEKSDFILTSYDENNENHKRYITTGTSGTFQLVYGFLKPCIILEDFSQINGFDENNSIFYKKADEYNLALKKAILMTQNEYAAMQNNLETYQKELYNLSLNNFKKAIGSKYEHI